MGVRQQPVSTNALFNELFRRVKSLEDSTKRQALPAGYEFKVISGALNIVRTADGATLPLGI